MTRPLQQLINALRLELQQYGELLAWLDEPRRAGARRGEGWFPLEPHGHALLSAQRASRHSQSQLAWAAEQPDAGSFGELIPSLPPDYQPLVTALVEENQSLWHRVRDRLRQDFCWINRAREISQRCLAEMSFARTTTDADRPTAPSPSLTA